MKQITISLSEYERLKDLVAQADTRNGLEMAALERRYQEKIAEMERMHQAEQVKEMAVYKARAEAAEGAATDLCGDFVDFVCEGVCGNAAEYCANRSTECVDAYGECDMGGGFCKGFFPEAAREWTKRSIQEE